ncbi:adenylate/guanylate cyclase domain-containing protein [Phaeodactylibacter luteus]|uniref:Adenylate/guanylate cyclase domain-containing protein n=1 Tax=Phaeodactylibacter luteus TaxID=1564516 RepID=A0A5C6S2U5_9BACT|nr:adenylate/guanylate cyclase domain-containing protein [Phaeodactylibacter luteus]TXB68949.1 adenylate/guanylate cyclase domain-containing protein [Phaeodactylibacter luteus]
MRTLFLLPLLLSLLLPASLLSQEGPQQRLNHKRIELGWQLIKASRFDDALRLAREIENRAGRDAAQLAAAKVLEARARAGQHPARLSRRDRKQVEKALLDARDLLREAPVDSLSRLARRVGLLLDGYDPSSTAPGGVAQQKPTLDALKAQKIELFSAIGDTIRNLQQQRAQFEAQVSQLSLEQARQKLALAQQQKALDSIALARLQDSLTVSQQEQQLQVQEAELLLQETQRNRSLILAAAIILIAAILTVLYFNSRRSNRVLATERKRSDELLRNILPATVAEELKSNGQAQARHFEEVTVLFTDFENFSRIAKDLQPDALVKALDECFRAFDAITEKHGLEKIKTIGDAYMCAAGLTGDTAQQASRAIAAALDIQAWLDKAAGLPFNKARIGIHTGPVTAGVVGARKFAYDIWGDTVNTAARLESNGEPGRVNVSQTTMEQAEGPFTFLSRGKIAAKGVGEIDMYFVEAAAGQPKAIKPVG